MTKNAVFTMKLEPELRDAFMAAAAASHRPASQIMRELIRDFIQSKKDAEAYNAYLRRQVELGRAQIKAGKTYSNEEVDAHMAKVRSEFLERS
jgi:predicted transcriptional regulator